MQVHGGTWKLFIVDGFIFQELVLVKRSVPDRKKKGNESGENGPGPPSDALGRKHVSCSKLPPWLDAGGGRE